MIKIIHAPQDYKYRRRNGPRLPILVDDESGVIWELQRYIFYRFTMRKISVGTLNDEAYILKSWMSFLIKQNVNLVDSSNYTISDFYEYLKEKGIGERRLARTIDVIFKFYVHSSSSYDEYRGMVADPLNGLDGPGFPISVEIAYKRDKGRLVPRYVCAVKIDRSGGSLPRPTPDEEQVDAVLTKLNAMTSTSEMKFMRWLMAGWMYYSTLRCGGVAQVSVPSIAGALAEHGVVTEGGDPYDLKNASDEQKAIITEKVSELRKKGFTFISVIVIEKGRKKRKVPLPLDHLEYNLHYIWNIRPDFVRKIKDDCLFLSRKTGRGYQPNSIGNMINAAFKEAKVPGSAHRLRAACLERLTREAFFRHMAMHGSAWDRKMVLMEIAEVAGHARIKTLRRYLNRLVAQFSRHAGSPILVRDAALASKFRGLLKRMERDNQLAASLATFLDVHQIEPEDQFVAAGITNELKRIKF